MLKKTITYTDFDDRVRTEDFYFNLSKRELAKMELSENLRGGLSKVLQEIMDTNDGRVIIDKFEEIIRMSYGVKTADGKSFIKDPEEVKKFMGSAAYDELFEQLVTDAKLAAEFVNGIVPAEISNQVQSQQYQPQNQPVFPTTAQQAELVQEQVPPPLPPVPSFDPGDRPPHESGPGYQH